MGRRSVSAALHSLLFGAALAGLDEYQEPMTPDKRAAWQFSCPDYSTYSKYAMQYACRQTRVSAYYHN